MSVWIYVLAGLALVVVVNVIIVVLLLHASRVGKETRDRSEAGRRHE